MRDSNTAIYFENMTSLFFKKTKKQTKLITPVSDSVCVCFFNV